MNSGSTPQILLGYKLQATVTNQIQLKSSKRAGDPHGRVTEVHEGLSFWYGNTHTTHTANRTLYTQYKLTERNSDPISQKPWSGILMPLFFPGVHQLWLNYVSPDWVPSLRWQQEYIITIRIR